MTKTPTIRSYQKTKVRWVVFGLLVAILLSLFILYAVPGLSGRLGLPALMTRTSYTNPIFDFDFPDPSIL
jgi:hypothetical protein